MNFLMRNVFLSESLLFGHTIWEFLKLKHIICNIQIVYVSHRPSLHFQLDSYENKQDTIDAAAALTFNPAGGRVSGI